MLHHLQHVVPNTLEGMFASFTDEAFRLECLQSFDVTEEAPLLARFLHDRFAAPPADLISEWCTVIKEATARGAAMKRVRLVSPPISDYLHFEISWGYATSLAAGEDISIIEVENLRDLPVKADTPLKDFWLFDDRSAFVMDYDLRGRFFGAWRADEVLCSRLLEAKTSLLAIASPILDTKYRSFMEASYGYGGLAKPHD